MDGAAPRDFRQVLRTATRADHDRVDALVSGLDLSTRAGFARFLRVHLACFAALDAAASGPDGLGRVVAALRSDLGRVEPRAALPTVALPPIDPLAAAYMVEGSRMGTQVLRPRWVASRDPVVAAADAYFGLPPAPGAWRAVREGLSSIDPDGSRARRIVSDARAVFAAFEAALHATV